MRTNTVDFNITGVTINKSVSELLKKDLLKGKVSTKEIGIIDTLGGQVTDWMIGGNMVDVSGAPTERERLNEQSRREGGLERGAST